MGVLQEWVVFAAVCFIWVNLAWVGLVRPILLTLLNMFVSPPIPSHSNRCAAKPGCDG